MAECAARVDEARMRRLVADHYDAIWRALRHLGVTEARAEDAAQQVFIVATHKIGPVAANRERAFLFAVALRVASDERRSQRRRPSTRDVEEAGAIADARPLADEMLDRERARAVFEAMLADLPEELRAVFVLSEVEELTMQRVAALLALPQGTVASRLKRARALVHGAIARYQARVRGPR